MSHQSGGHKPVFRACLNAGGVIKCKNKPESICGGYCCTCWNQNLLADAKRQSKASPSPSSSSSSNSAFLSRACHDEGFGCPNKQTPNCSGYCSTCWNQKLVDKAALRSNVFPSPSPSPVSPSSSSASSSDAGQTADVDDSDRYDHEINSIMTKLQNLCGARAMGACDEMRSRLTRCPACESKLAAPLKCACTVPHEPGRRCATKACSSVVFHPYFSRITAFENSSEFCSLAKGLPLINSFQFKKYWAFRQRILEHRLAIVELANLVGASALMKHLGNPFAPIPGTEEHTGGLSSLS